MELKKYFQKIKVIICFIYIVMCCFSTNIILSRVQYKTNCEKLQNKNITIIHNQDIYSNIQYGLGNIAYNGCGAVAVYNLLYLDGNDVSFGDIVRDVSSSGLNIFGALGTFPHGVVYTLGLFNYTCSYCVEESAFDEFAQQNQYNILCYFGLAGGHYELIFDYNGYSYQIINPTCRKSFSEILEQLTKYPIKILIGVNK